MTPNLILLRIAALVVAITAWQWACGEQADAQRLEPTRRSYPAVVHRVVDADTFILDVELGFDVFVRVPIRLEGLDAPEMPTEAGQRAKAAAERLFATAKLIHVEPSGARSFARWVGRIYLDGVLMRELLEPELRP